MEQPRNLSDGVTLEARSTWAGTGGVTVGTSPGGPNSLPVKPVCIPGSGAGA